MSTSETHTKSRLKVGKRSNAMRLSVADGMAERLEAVAKLYGIPPATLAALAVGEYVSKHEANLGIQQKIADAMADSVGGQIGEQLKMMFKAELEKADE